MTRPRLPGRTSTRVGPNQATDSLEWFESRRRELTQHDDYMLFTMDPMYSVAGVTLAANRAIYMPIKVLTHDFTPTHAHVRITTAAAGAKLHTALYRYESRPTPRLLMLPRFHADYDVSSTGIRAVEYDFDTPIPDGTYLWAGFMSSSSTTRFAGKASVQSPIHIHYKDGVTDLSETVILNDLDTPAASVPCVAFLSAEAKKVF